MSTHQPQTQPPDYMTVTTPQPWATAAVFGTVDVINVPKRNTKTGWAFVHSSRWVDHNATADQRVMNLVVPYGAGKHASANNAVVGAVRIRGCVRRDDCELLFSFGPWCLLVDHPVLFLEPLDIDRWLALDIDTRSSALEELAASGLSPAAALRKLTQQELDHADPEAVYPKRQDGWVGD